MKKVAQKFGGNEIKQYFCSVLLKYYSIKQHNN